MPAEIRFDGRARVLPLPDGRLVVPLRPEGFATGTTGRFEPEVLAAAADGASRLLVLINDDYRPTPTAAMLRHSGPALQAAGAVRVLVATGMHPAPAPAAVRARVGEVLDGLDVRVHDANDEGRPFGTLTDGTRLQLNPLVDWADRILLLGSVEPHFFAGFTGGAKQLLPGVATRRTIEANHRHAVHPNCRPCRIMDNPVARPIRETAALFGDRLASFQAVAGPEGWEFFAGSEPETFAAATRRCAETATLIWPEPLDLLVAVVHEPLDRNLYQLQKGFENHQWAVRDGGRLLLVSACRDGWGNGFFPALADRYPDWRNLPPWEDQPYSLGLHKLYRTAAALSRIGLYLHSTLPEETVRKIYIEPVDDLDRWLDRHVTTDLRVGLVPDAAGTVSTLKSEHVVE